MRSKGDRPYGRFPSDVAEDAAPDAPAAPPQRLRDRILGSGRVRRIRVGFGTLGVLLILAGLIGATQPAPRVALPRPTPAPSPTVEQIYQQVSQSVVSIRVAEGNGSAIGTGIIVDDTGTILTSWHVVNGGGRIVLTFADGTQSDATVMTAVPERDLAVLRPSSPPANLTPAVLGDPSRLQVGDAVYAIGDPLGLTSSYSSGIVSGLERTVHFSALPQPLDRLIQFDAAVNPGSSGGPLIDGRGEVVGVVTGIPENDRGAFAGIGFAVRIDQTGGALGIPPD